MALRITGIGGILHKRAASNAESLHVSDKIAENAAHKAAKLGQSLNEPLNFCCT
jgi:hypothetical protein